MSCNVVSLSVPAQSRFARCVRMTAANLAVVINMDVDDVEDLRMAAEEGFVYACATGASLCEITFTLAPQSVSIDFSLGDVHHADDDALQYADLLLSAICDEYAIDEDHKQLHLMKCSSCVGGANAN
ncbi:serine/threonine protein kinase [Atopobium deltae]|nr:serine/threonine protein kinase [Atopobium deltae]